VTLGNVDKTKIVVFSIGRLPRNLIFNYNGTNIEIVKDFNYLGIYFSRTGSFKVCKNHLYEKAMYEVMKKGRKHNLSINCQFDLFDKLVKPILLYGCEIWGFGNNDILEKVHLKFCKIILQLKATTPNCMIYGQLGRYPLDIDIKLRNILFWAKLITGKDIKLSIISYRLLYLSQNNNCQFSWLNYVESILNECGRSYVWLNQNFISEEWLKNSVKTCLQDQFQQTWHANIDTGVTYSFFPHTHFSPRKNEYILRFPPGKMSIY
jgi:hypothetical protein